MNLLTIITIGFLILEATNVVTLYFSPGSQYANGVDVSKAWETSKADLEIHNYAENTFISFAYQDNLQVARNTFLLT